jgi:hypothetical protein
MEEELHVDAEAWYSNNCDAQDCDLWEEMRELSQSSSSF